MDTISVKPISVLAFRYPNFIDFDTDRSFAPIKIESDSEKIKDLINNLLFKKKTNYLLIRSEEEYFICEVVDKKKKIYSTRPVKYHPDLYMFDSNANSISTE
jgi:hypothetical protein